MFKVNDQVKLKKAAGWHDMLCPNTIYKVYAVFNLLNTVYLENVGITVNFNCLELVSRPEKHCDVIKAWADGATIQAYYDNTWNTCIKPSFDDSISYRVKPVITTYSETNKFDVYYAASAPFNNESNIPFTTQLVACTLKVTRCLETNKITKIDSVTAELSKN